MKSDWLESFLVFSETLNFTRAAEMLHISQPALHVKIGKLSEYIGKPLYEKSGRNLILTPEGLQLQAFARDQLEQTQGFLQVLREGASKQEVSLSAGEGTLLYLLGNPLSAFMNESTVKLKIITGDHNQILKNVLSGEANIGVAPMESGHTDLECVHFTRVGQVLVLPKNHTLAKKRKVNLGLLNGEKLIVPPEGKPHRIMINRLLMDAQVEWTPAAEVTSWELMLRFVQHGMGLAIVNEYCSIPNGLVAKSLSQFPAIQFHLIKRIGAARRDSIIELERILLRYKDTWKDVRKKQAKD